MQRGIQASARLRRTRRSNSPKPPMRSPPSSMYCSRRVSCRSSLERCSTDRRSRIASRAHPGAHAVRARLPTMRAYSKRSEELAFLANTIMAGCSIQARPFTRRRRRTRPSRSATLAWRTGRRRPAAGTRLVARTAALPDDFLVGHDLVSVFQVGWTVLHDGVSMYAAEQLIEVLTQSAV